ncbi:MAG TPA: hypothetical protein VFT38_02430 [Vicinamibacteria bacterium]|nr:hypothetical protein [Vicinamibacteria bacterium]
MTRSRRSSLTVLSFVLAAFTAQVAVANGKPVLRLHAFAVNLSGPAPARTGTLDVTIERWSTPAEAAKLRDMLAEKGADALLETLQKMPRAGSIQRTGRLGWDVHFAQQVVAADGSRRIVLATDRPMSFWEAANQPRSADYAFTLAEIRLGPDGKGEGKLVPAAKIDYDKESNTLEIENYNTEPTRLTEVVAEK